jgi:hypothetical protein
MKKIKKKLGKTAQYYKDNPSAYKKKLEKDKEINERAEQIIKRVECNKARRDAIKKGKDISGKDYDHATKKFIDPKINRGRSGEGGRKKK